MKEILGLLIFVAAVILLILSLTIIKIITQKRFKEFCNKNSYTYKPKETVALDSKIPEFTSLYSTSKELIEFQKNQISFKIFKARSLKYYRHICEANLKLPKFCIKTKLTLPRKVNDISDNLNYRDTDLKHYYLLTEEKSKFEINSELKKYLEEYDAGLLIYSTGKKVYITFDNVFSPRNIEANINKIIEISGLLKSN